MLEPIEGFSAAFQFSLWKTRPVSLELYN